MPLMGVAAIVVDLGYAYVQRTSLQQAADSAALAGAMAYNGAGTTASLQATVQAVVVANGWAASVIQSPSSEYLAQSPANAADKAVQVTLQTQVPLTFGRMITKSSTLQVQVQSIAQLAPSGLTACVLALVQLQINGIVNTPNCAVAANSALGNAVTVNGSGSLTANTVSGFGGITDSGTINTSAKRVTGKLVTDPYTATQVLATAASVACTALPSSSILTAGCYNSGVISTPVTLQAGTYFFQSLNINPGGSITGTGVTVIMGQNFSPSGNVTLTAPSAGAWDGVALYLMNGANFNPTMQYAINGAIYAPTQSLMFDNVNFNSNSCTYVVAQNVTFNGGSSFTLPQTNCGSFTAPKTSTGSAKVALVQ